jgi:hypothetical protein
MYKIISEPSLCKDPITGAILLQDSDMYKQYIDNLANIQNNNLRLVNLEISVIELSESLLEITTLLKQLLQK